MPQCVRRTLDSYGSNRTQRIASATVRSPVVRFETTRVVAPGPSKNVPSVFQPTCAAAPSNSMGTSLSGETSSFISKAPRAPKNVPNALGT